MILIVSGGKSARVPVHLNKMQQDSLTLLEKNPKNPNPTVEIPFTPKQLISPKETGLLLLPGYNCVCDLVVTGRQTLNSFREKFFVHADKGATWEKKKDCKLNMLIFLMSGITFSRTFRKFF